MVRAEVEASNFYYISLRIFCDSLSLNDSFFFAVLIPQSHHAYSGAAVWESAPECVQELRRGATMPR